MTMHINLSPEMEGFIKAKVAGGFYGNATEVIRDAIRRMQTEEERVAQFVAAVAKGEAQLKDGQGLRYTPAVSQNILQEALARAASGRPVANTDVLP
jgi:antitoxin ParD1/3/4